MRRPRYLRLWRRARRHKLAACLKHQSSNRGASIQNALRRRRNESPHFENSTSDLCCNLHEWLVFSLRGRTEFYASAAFSTLRARAAQIVNSQLGLVRQLRRVIHERRLPETMPFAASCPNSTNADKPAFCIHGVCSCSICHDLYTQRSRVPLTGRSTAPETVESKPLTRGDRSQLTKRRISIVTECP